MHLVLDIDSTIFPLLQAMSLCPGGEKIEPEACYYWGRLEEMCDGNQDEVILRALQPEIARQVGLYPGVYDTVHALASEGVQIEFATHRDAEARHATEVFLEEHGLGDFPLFIGPGFNKAEYLLGKDPGVLVDDAPYVLEEAGRLGIQVVALAQPYNEEICHLQKIPSAKSWQEMHGILRKFLHLA